MEKFSGGIKYTDIEGKVLSQGPSVFRSLKALLFIGSFIILGVIAFEGALLGWAILAIIVAIIIFWWSKVIVISVDQEKNEITVTSKSIINSSKQIVKLDKAVIKLQEKYTTNYQRVDTKDYWVSICSNEDENIYAIKITDKSELSRLAEILKDMINKPVEIKNLP